MRVEVFETYTDLSQRAAAMVADLVRRRPGAVLGMPTGSTPVGFYRALRESGVSFRQAQTFNLDEYVGLPRAHHQSYCRFMYRHLYTQVDLLLEHCHIPNGMAPDPDAECVRYEELLRRAGGLDIVLLGIGHNGHIGFNEPGSPWDARTRRVPLAERTRQANARFFGSLDAVPREALTMGIGTILESRQILLLASGEDKAEIIRRTLEGEPDVQVPATALQQHPNVTVLIDKAAARVLRQTA